jgi:hypothetical protein
VTYGRRSIRHSGKYRENGEPDADRRRAGDPRDLASVPPALGRFTVKVINHVDDEVMKVFQV